MTSMAKDFNHIASGYDFNFYISLPRRNLILAFQTNKKKNGNFCFEFEVSGVVILARKSEGNKRPLNLTHRQPSSVGGANTSPSFDSELARLTRFEG